MQFDTLLSMKLNISYQGIPGAYSWSACQQAFDKDYYEPMDCPDFLSAIKAVQQGKASCAMLPVNNKIAGRVADIHRLIPDSGLYIVGEYYLPIKHCLLGIPGTKISDIKHVTSHVHALPQCERYIDQYGWNKVTSGDTATAAQKVHQKQEKEWAAIASPDAAELYNLEILADNIADVSGNVTRFIMMAPEASYPSKYTTDVKTSMLFSLKHDGPAQLYHALGGFAKNGINMTTLESYHDDNLNLSRFLCEVEKHAESPAMQAALEEMKTHVDVKILGVYQKHSYNLGI